MNQTKSTRVSIVTGGASGIGRATVDALIAAGFDKELVMRVIGLVDRAEYKRRQYPPGTKVSQRAFGKDRRLPMTSKWREL